MADRCLGGLVLLRVHPQTVENLHPVIQDFLRQVRPQEIVGSIVTLDSSHYRLRRIR